MQKLLPIVIVFAALMLIGCTVPGVTPTCNKPYILVGTDCCLDQNNNSICDTDEVMACPADAKVCSDGTVVTRILPNCEFTACPAYQPNETGNESENGIALKEFKVLLVGWNFDVVDVLEQLRPEINISMTMISSENPSLGNESYMLGYDLVVVSNTQNYTPQLRASLDPYLQNSGRVILVKDALTKDPEDPLYNGWGHLQIPLQLATTGTDVPITTVSSASIRVLDINHQMVANSENLESSINKIFDFVEVRLPTGCVQCETIFVISMDYGSNQIKTYSAIVEQNSLIGGKIFYFAYEPSLTPEILKNAVKHILGLS